MTERGDNQTELQCFANKVGLHFQDWALLESALTHPSHVNEHKTNLPDNERLEFLGDSVLGLVISHFLFEKYLDNDEGFLSKIKGIVVSQPVLAEIGKTMQLGEMVLLGKGACRSGDRNRPSIIADALEAIIGAIFLDSGLERAKAFILANWEKVISQVASGEIRYTYSSELQELLQKHLKAEPFYTLVSENGPDNEKTFVMQVAINDIILGQGEDRTKKGASQLAARQALNAIMAAYPDSTTPISLEQLAEKLTTPQKSRPPGRFRKTRHMKRNNNA